MTFSGPRSILPFPKLNLRGQDSSCPPLQIHPTVRVIHLTRVGCESLYQAPDCSRVIAFGSSDLPSPCDLASCERLVFRPLQKCRQVGGHLPVHGRVYHIFDPTCLCLVFYKPIQHRKCLPVEPIDRVCPMDDPQLPHFICAPHNMISADVVVQESREPERR